MKVKGLTLTFESEKEARGFLAEIEEELEEMRRPEYEDLPHMAEMVEQLNREFNMWASGELDLHGHAC